ncbi:hypothetical protein ACHAW6_000945 [Cyclotella cf. meneghiniana]
MSYLLPPPTIPDIVMHEDISVKEESARDQSITEEGGNDNDDINPVAPKLLCLEPTETLQGVNNETGHDEYDTATNAPQIDYHALTASPTDAQGNPLRRGKWTPEESDYANRLILEFRRGTLPLPPNATITLREFLSKLLRCDPMRITKKFEGDNCLRKVVYKSSLVSGQEDMTNGVREEIRELEAKFLERLDKTKSTSSQAVSDKALLESLRSEGEGKDLIDMFCEGMQWETSRERVEEGHIATQTRAERETQRNSLKRQHQPQTDEIDALSFQEALVTQLQNMQKLIQGQHHRHLGGLALQEVVNINVEREQSESSILPFLKKIKIESNYNSAMANLLTVQRMILDSKHKLYDLEFDLGDINFKESNASDGDDVRERKVEAIKALREEIACLDAQRADIESDIEEKYRRGQD